MEARYFEVSPPFSVVKFHEVELPKARRRRKPEQRVVKFHEVELTQSMELPRERRRRKPEQRVVKFAGLNSLFAS